MTFFGANDAPGPSELGGLGCIEVERIRFSLRLDGRPEDLWRFVEVRRLGELGGPDLEDFFIAWSAARSMAREQLARSMARTFRRSNDVPRHSREATSVEGP